MVNKDVSNIIRLESAYFGRYVSEPNGPFSEGGLGYLSKTTGFPEDAAEIDDWIRGSDKRLIFDPDREEKDMVFGVFGKSGFWGVQIGSRKDPSGKGRAAKIARIWLLPKAQNWRDLPIGIFSFLTTLRPLEPLIKGYPATEQPILFEPKISKEKINVIINEWDNLTPRIERITRSSLVLLAGSTTKGDTKVAAALPLKLSEAKSYAIHSELIGIELEFLKKYLHEETASLSIPFSLNGLFKNLDSYISFSAVIKKLPKLTELEKQHKYIRSSIHNIAATNESDLFREAISVSKDGHQRRIGNDPIYLPSWFR